MGMRRHEMTLDIKWVPEDLDAAVEAGTHNRLGTPLGPMSVFSPPIRKVLDEPFSTDVNDTYTKSIGNTIMAALERAYPEIESACVRISCTAIVRAKEAEE